MNYGKRHKNADTVDQWLESRGYFRKHTARDSTCLFRVFSEQLFFTQKYHLKVRAACVKYMKENTCLFEEAIDGPVDLYLERMSEVNEFGGPLEIEAMSKLYKCEVFIFERSTEVHTVAGNGFSKQVLMYHVDRHYDSVFYKSYIQNAAFCQGLSYQILYKSVFKLPDVEYAVNKMLHECDNDVKYDSWSKDDEITCYSENKWSEFKEEADPYSTLCVLEDTSKCSFHKISHDEGILDELDNEGVNNTVENNSKVIKKQAVFKSFLYQHSDNDKSSDMSETENKNQNSFTSMIPEFVARLLNLTDFHATDTSTSCVKQMLKENLTPFPYKVAKALDEDIYRNIEFDTWNEVRRELRYGNWYQGGTNLQVGVKCRVKLSENQSTWYHCHIQEMPLSNEPCVVFVEELGEKRSVPREFLQPLPLEQVKPWALPYRHYRNLASVIHNSKIFSFTGNDKLKKSSRLGKSRKIKDASNNCKSDINQYLINGNNVKNFERILNVQEVNHLDTEFGKRNQIQEFGSFQCGMDSCDSLPYVNDFENVSAVISQPKSEYFIQENCRIQDYTPDGINYSSPKSILYTGADLPFNDTPTLRFFYNLGVDCFNSTCSGRKPYKDVNMETGVMLSSMENKNMSEATMIECNTNEDDFCFNFQNKLLTKNNFNESLIEETFGTSSSILKVARSDNDSPCMDAVILSENISNSCLSVGTPVSNRSVAQANSPVLVAYTQVPGMYSTMVPCYPVEEGGNLYIAQYMGMPFGIIPQIDGQLEPTQDQTFNSNVSSSIVYQTSGAAPYINQPIGDTGYYQNHVWYPSTHSFPG